MFKKETTKRIILCITVTFTISVLLFCVFYKLPTLPVVILIVVTYIINTYLAVILFRNQFREENEERENVLKKQVESSSNHLATIMNNLPLVTYIMDTDYNFVTGNIEALKLFGYEGEGQLRGLSEEIFERDTMELMQKEMDYIVRNKKPFVTDRLVKLKTGQQNWFKIRKVPLLDSKNEVKGVVVFGRNIDAEKQAARQRETYISTLSHDLKIPTLAQIRALELLLDESMGKVNDDQKEILNLTLDSCKYMYEMLSTILSTYKYENKDVMLDFEKIDIMNLIDENFSKTGKLLKDKNIQVKMSAKDSAYHIFADKVQLGKAFENLVDHCVSNAYENSTIICEFSKSTNEQQVYVSLAFESPYVTSENLRNLFKRYTTSAEKMDKVGSGLGLYLAKQIIDAHNGSIYVESTEANYSTYNIELPCINECKVDTTNC